MVEDTYEVDEDKGAQYEIPGIRQVGHVRNEVFEVGKVRRRSSAERTEHSGNEAESYDHASGEEARYRQNQANSLKKIVQVRL